MKNFKKFISLLVVLSIMLLSISCGKKASTVSVSGDDSKDLYIYNFGDYLAEDAIKLFESETGITVHQDLFEANEEAMTVLENGRDYDIVCISDYCIERMREKGLLQPVDKSKIPNIVNINKEKLDMLSVCDKGNEMAVPYFCGTMGIMYNKTKLESLNMPLPTKWADLFNPVYKGELLMQSSVRDLYTVGLKKNGFSVNSTNKAEIDRCTEEFIEQKPYVQAYLTDQVKEKILSGEAAIAPITSGDVQYVYVEGGEDEYCFIIPEEGTQMFIDAWCIPKNAKNINNAHIFIDYMCREDVAKINAEYVGYESVNDKTPDEEFLYMKKIDGAYIDYSNGNFELERDVKDADSYYIEGFNKIRIS